MAPLLGRSGSFSFSISGVGGFSCDCNGAVKGVVNVKRF